MGYEEDEMEGVQTRPVPRHDWVDVDHHWRPLRSRVRGTTRDFAENCILHRESDVCRSHMGPEAEGFTSKMRFSVARMMECTAQSS